MADLAMKKLMTLSTVCILCNAFSANNLIAPPFTYRMGVPLHHAWTSSQLNVKQYAPITQANYSNSNTARNAPTSNATSTQIRYVCIVIYHDANKNAVSEVIADEITDKEIANYDYETHCSTLANDGWTKIYEASNKRLATYQKDGVKCNVIMQTVRD